MATRNYFAMDPAISRTVSNLTRALIGSPSDDAASARARYYDEQTKAQQLKSRGLEEQLDAQTAAAAGNILRNQVANVFGGQLDNGNLIRRPLPGGPQQSVPLLPNQNQMSQEDVANQLGALARSMYGDGTSNANQLSQMLGNLAESGQSRLAQSMILGGSPDQAQRGALMLKGGNKYNNPDFAMTELRTDDATARREQDMKIGLGGQGDRDTKAQETTKMALGQEKNRNTRDVGMDKNARQERWEKYKADVRAKVDRDKNEAADATARYKIDNKPVEINVTPGKMIILDPETAERIGVSPINDPNSEFNGLHILDGGKKPGDVVVKVGKEDVFMDEATAKALNIPQNDKGQYVLPGAGYSTSSSGSGSGSSFTVGSSDDTGLRETFNNAADAAEMPDLPAGVQDLLVQRSTSNAVMGDKKNIPKGKAYIKQQLRKGFVEFEIPETNILPQRVGGQNDKFKVPKFMIEFIKENLKKRQSSLGAMRADAVARQNVINKFISAGYTDVQAAIIVDGMQ